MLLVGLTGGIGSGKSTVAAMLKQRGAVVIDADELARRAVDPGTPAHDRVIEAFGPGVVTDSGDVDRRRLARIVFADPEARRELEDIVHPEVARLFARAVEPYRETGKVVVYVVPLLVERSLQAGFDVVMTISASPETRRRRLLARGLTDEDIRGRIASQLSDQERERAADVVIRNDGNLEELERSVESLWGELELRGPEG